MISLLSSYYLWLKTSWQLLSATEWGGQIYWILMNMYSPCVNSCGLQECLKKVSDVAPIGYDVVCENSSPSELTASNGLHYRQELNILFCLKQWHHWNQMMIDLSALGLLFIDLMRIQVMKSLLQSVLQRCLNLLQPLRRSHLLSPTTMSNLTALSRLCLLTILTIYSQAFLPALLKCCLIAWLKLKKVNLRQWSSSVNLLILSEFAYDVQTNLQKGSMLKVYPSTRYLKVYLF